MKKIIYVFIAVLILPLITYGQHMRRDDKGPFKKIEELEKIKIIEALGMDETTTLKFFARRTKFREEQGRLFDDSNTLLNKMEEEVKSGTKNDAELKNDLSQYWEIQNKLEKHKEEFFNSLTDILSYNQITELIVFEKKFRDEIRKVLFQERQRRLK